MFRFMRNCWVILKWRLKQLDMYLVQVCDELEKQQHGK